MVGLATITLVAAGLHLWRLYQNGHGNFSRADAVLSMVESFADFCFGSFDPIGFVTGDKPRGAIWIQALNVKLFGFGSLSVLLPQALMERLARASDDRNTSLSRLKKEVDRLLALLRAAEKNVQHL